MPVGVIALLVAACAQRPPARIAGDGEFVLELGGSNRSLAASLRALGVELLPARAAPEPQPQDGNQAGNESDGGVDGPGADGSSAPDAGERDPGTDREAAAGPAWIEVRLASKQTLMDLAKEHLGTSRRFQEIMELNGWSDRDARRLKVGQVVRIPMAATR
jgi:nucleoid-associated protein YgaU